MEQFKKGQIVLVRQQNGSVWRVRVYYSPGFCHFDGTPGEKTKWEYIIPYEGNEGLYGTTKNPSPKPKEGEWWMCERKNGDIVVHLFFNGCWHWWKGESVMFNDVEPLCRMIQDPDGQPTKT